MKLNKPRLLAILGVLVASELAVLGATEARAQWVGGPGWYAGRYRVRVRGRGYYPAPVVAVPVAPAHGAAYVESPPVVVTETQIVRPAPVVESRVVQPAPVLERRVVQPPPVVETRLVQPAPVVERRLVQPAPVVQSQTYTTYPY